MFRAHPWAAHLCVDAVPVKVGMRGGDGGGGAFPPQGQGAHLFISLPEVTMKFYAVLCSDDERDQPP